MSGVNKLMKLFFFGVALTACAEKSQYYRSECIVRVNVDWTTSNGDKNQLLQQIFDVYPNAPELRFNRAPPSSAVQGDMDQFLYFQYKYDCEKRISNTKSLLEYVRENVKGLPEMEVDTGDFHPGSDTIRASGKWWIDGDASPFSDQK